MEAIIAALVHFNPPMPAQRAGAGGVLPRVHGEEQRLPAWGSLDPEAPLLERDLPGNSPDWGWERTERPNGSYRKPVHKHPASTT